VAGRVRDDHGEVHLGHSPESLRALTIGTLCIRRDAGTPLVVTPIQAVSTGPRRARRSILPRGQERWRGGAPLGERTERTDGGKHTKRGDCDQDWEWDIQRIELSGGSPQAGGGGPCFGPVERSIHVDPPLVVFQTMGSANGLSAVPARV